MSKSEAFAADMRAAGVAADSPWDLVSSRASYPDAIPVLVEWLDRAERELRPGARPRFREGLVRALTVKEARGVAGPALLREFWREGAAGGHEGTGHHRSRRRRRRGRPGRSRGRPLMSPLVLRWDPDRRYRAFVHRPVGAATIVSSRIVDDGRVLEHGAALFAVDLDGFVCDVEVRIDAMAGAGSVGAPGKAVRVAQPVRTVVETAAAQPDVALTPGWLVLDNGGEASRGRWIQLADQPLFLLVSDDGALLAVAATAQDDPGGLAESQWLDEVEAAATFRRRR